MTPDDPDFGDDGIIDLYVGTFAARDDLYVENGAGVVRSPLIASVIRKGIAHQYPVSVYMSAPDGRTHVGAIDFDTEDGAASADLVRAYLDDANIPASVSPSRRGAHLWVTSWDWVEASLMRRALKGAVALVLGAEAAADPKVEVFPKPGDDLACGALRLPGMAHHRTQQVYPFGGIENPTFRQIIESHELTTPEAVKRIAGATPRPQSEYPKALGDFYGHKPQRDWGEDPSASDVLVAWGVQGAKPGATVRCPKHDDKRRSLTVFRDDKRVYCGAPHCPLNNGGHGVGSVMLARMT